jgi:hypothetical protein
MPTVKQASIEGWYAEMDSFFNTKCHDDYDYDWLCPHESGGCDEC